MNEVGNATAIKKLKEAFESSKALTKPAQAEIVKPAFNTTLITTNTTQASAVAKVITPAVEASVVIPVASSTAVSPTGSSKPIASAIASSVISAPISVVKDVIVLPKANLLASPVNATTKIGCYQDHDQTHILGDVIFNSFVSNATQMCEKAAKYAGATYFGLEAGVQCHYGIPKTFNATLNGPKLKDSDCNMNCGSNDETALALAQDSPKCGGNSKITIYQLPVVIASSTQSQVTQQLFQLS